MFPIRWSDEALNQGCSSSCDRCAMHQTPGIGCDISKRKLRVEPFQVRSWNDESSELGFRKTDSAFVSFNQSIEQICSSEDLDQVFDCLGGNASALGAKHIREVFPGHLVDLRARSGALCFMQGVRWPLSPFGDDLVPT